MIWATGAGLAVLILSAWQLGPLCIKLLPIAMLGVLLYPLCKRFWWGTHFVLGAVDALAPLGAYIGITGTIALPAVLLFVAVTVWVAGFDIIYALMDLGVDREQGLASVPSRLGENAGRRLPALLHVLMLCALALAGYKAGARRWYYLGVLASAAPTVYEERPFSAPPNVFVLNERIFLANMSFSLVFLATTLAGFALG